MTLRSRLKILFDHNTPSPLRQYLNPHDVDTANEKGWSGLANGHLIHLAIEQGYDILITADQNIRHQQNTSRSSIGIVVLLSNRWPLVRNHTDAIIHGKHSFTRRNVERPHLTETVVLKDTSTGCVSIELDNDIMSAIAFPPT